MFVIFCMHIFVKLHLARVRTASHTEYFVVPNTLNILSETISDCVCEIKSLIQGEKAAD